MDTLYLCTDCGAEHDDPGAANLGHQVICLDCALEVDLARELATLSYQRLAA